MRFRFLLGILVGMILPLHVFGAGVVINEVMFDPMGTDSGHEWIELYNSDSVARDISSWELYPDGIGYVVFPSNTIVMGNAFFTIHLRSQGVNSPTDFYYNTASSTSNMGNTSGSAALFSGEPRGKDTIKSFAEWGKAGQTWESDAEKAGLWTKGTYIDLINNAEGNSIGLSQDGLNAGGKDAWHIFTGPTMGGTNSTTISSGVPPLTETQSASSSISNGTSGTPLWIEPPTIKAYAGEDHVVAVGALIQFDGRATGFKDTLLTGARLWWNFGDGVTFEGRHATHVFQIPGVYLVGLHASDDIAAASDYAKITVVPNQLLLTRVVGGENGFIQFNNPTAVDLDIGGWIFDDADGKRFFVPEETKIGAHAEMAFSNTITGLLRGTVRYPFYVRYANSVIAMTIDHEINSVDGGISDPHQTLASSTQYAHISSASSKSLGSVVSYVVPTTSSSSATRVASSTRPYLSAHMAVIAAIVLGAIGSIGLFFIKL